MKLGRSLHPDFGVEIEDLDLREIDPDTDFPRVREAFESHSVLLFRGQNLDDDSHIRLARLFGPLEDRGDFDGFRVSRVTNVELDARPKEVRDSDQNLMNLKANMLWHTDSIFLPVPALANLLHAKVLPQTGGNTELVSTRAGWRKLTESLKSRVRGKVFLHRYSHSRKKVDPGLAESTLFQKWPDTRWPSLWRNPVNGEEALYLASHTFGIEDMEAEAGEALIEELIDALTQPEAVYSHPWKVGDVLIWDERATLHRGTPWPYEEARTLSSICVSVTASDGLGSMQA